MIKEHYYHGKLYNKITLTFEFETLKELRQLKEQFPAITIYYFKDCCLSFRDIQGITIETFKKTVKLQDGKIVSLFEYLTSKNDIKKLANPYTFTCECLRGYNNTYKIAWQTKTAIITAETKNNLWLEIEETHETATNEYVENTVRPVKLTPLHPQTLTKQKRFNTVLWSGGNMTTYNTDKNDDMIKAFDTALFEAYVT